MEHQLIKVGLQLYSKNFDESLHEILSVQFYCCKGIIASYFVLI